MERQINLANWGGCYVSLLWLLLGGCYLLLVLVAVVVVVLLLLLLLLSRERSDSPRTVRQHFH